MDNSFRRRLPWGIQLATDFNTGAATDFSRNAATPTVGAGATLSGHAYDFSGASTGVISYADTAELEDPPLTVMAWVYIDTYTSYRAIMTKISQAASYTGWHMYHGGGISRGLAFGHSSNVSAVGINYRQAWSAVGTLSAGVWYHCAATLSALNATALIYINGVAQSTTTATGGTVTTMAGTEVVRVAGKGGPDFTQYHDGKIDEPCAFNRVLSAAEIYGYFQTGKASHP